MFLFSILFGIVLGLVLRGKISNLENVKFNDLYLIAFGFGLEVITKVLVNLGAINIGIWTLISDIFMYLMLMIFVILNRKDKFVLLMGIGFMLNAIVIFSNGGAMPVSQSAMDSIAQNVKPSDYGLYVSMNDSKNLWLLGDIIYLDFLGPFVFSIGDIISGIGLVLIIISGMRGNYYHKEITHQRGRSSRKNRRARHERNKNNFNNVKKVLENIV